MEIGVLGPLEVRDGGSVLEVSGSRLRLLLTLLALEAPHAVSAGVLVESLWGDEPPADQTNALQSLVSRLRRALGEAAAVTQSAGGYRLDVSRGDVDVYRFGDLARDGRAALRRRDPATARDLLTQALQLWRGEPVELLDLAGSGRTHTLLARLDEQRLDARADLIDAQLGLGLADDVIADLDGLVLDHPLRERLAGLQMRALYAVGRQADALAGFDRVKRTLVDELGVDPSADLQALHLKILRGEATDRVPATISAATKATAEDSANTTGATGGVSTTRRRPLRAALTTFVGREEQLAQIGKLLAAGRLVTLVGPGGAGKTRLATEAAAALAAVSDSADVWLVELAPVTDPADVPQTVLGALGLRDNVLIERLGPLTPRDATARLVESLTTRHALIVLDNCEHLIEAAAQLTDQMLAHCPDLQMLTTSREPLGLFGEALLAVPPLSAPAPDAEPADARRSAAVQLFVDRAVDVQPDFVIDDSTVGPVVEIVRRLDGQPLAIELAAARLRTLPVAEIARRLSDRFRLLTGGSRTAMPRHRTLRAVVEWSWDLLTDSERLLAERLAVFTGGVAAPAAAQVCGGPDLAVEDIDDLLSSLVDKSLLQVATLEDDQPRYRMLETLREFGVERMAERGEVGRIRLAHARYFAALVVEADPHLRRREQLEWMAVLETERDNILAALKFFGDDGRPAEAIDLVSLLGWYWMTVGRHGEVVTWGQFALAIEGAVETPNRLMVEAFLAINTVAANTAGTEEEVQASLDRLAEISRRLTETPDDAPDMMTLLAPIVAMFIDRDDDLEAVTARALAHPDPWIAAATRTFRASMAENNGDVATMRADSEASLTVFRELGDRWGIANSLRTLGQLELMEGNLAEAAAAYQEALELSEAFGSGDDVSMMRLRLADILTRMGHPDAGLREAELARAGSSPTGSPMEVLFANIVQVDIARTCGDLELARRLRDESIEQLRLLPSVHPIQGHGLAVILAIAAKIDIDAGEHEGARTQLEESHTLAVKTRDMPILATVGVSVAMLAVLLGELDDAAEILGASATLRGADDPTQPDILVMDTQFGGLQAGPRSAAYRRGRAMSREAATARVHPASITAEPQR